MRRHKRLSAPLAGVSLIIALVSLAAHAQSGSARSLFGAYGSTGVVPVNPPADFLSWFAVVVVEIDSAVKSANVAVSDFELMDQAGHALKYKRLISVEEFDRARVATEGECAYWTNSGGTRPWDGTLPQGKIRLRVRVALEEKPLQWDRGARFRLTLAEDVIEGLIECVLPS